jgi:hypothetical protein
VLRKAGVAGVEDFGRFVNDTRHFRPSAFDARAALPVLAEVLPSLADPRVVETVAAYLAGPWSRSALPALIEAFRHWAPEFPLGAGWQPGNAIGAAADDACAADLLELAVDPQFGKARQMIVLCSGASASGPRSAPG